MAPCARTSWIVLVPLLLAACDDPPAAPEPPPREEAPAPPSEPEPEIHAAPPTTPDRPSAPVAAPEAGCAFGAPVRVHDAPGWVSVAPFGGGFVVAGLGRDGDGEQVVVSRIGGDGSVQELARGALENGAPDHRRAAPALATRGSRIALAVADGRARLMFAELDGGGALAWRSIAESASLRFTPALASHADGWAIAWTEEREHAMRVHAGRVVAGALTGARELAPEGGGSAASSFVAGATPPSIVLLDPRSGVSVVHRASLAGAAFGDPEVARPINLVTEPPEIAAVNVGGAPWLAYTAVGSAATTAVGLVPLSNEAMPTAIVPGSGYGVLHVDAAALPGDRGVFVADAPQASPSDSPRELHVRILEADGALGDAAIVRGPGGAASRGRIAHLADGVVAVAFTDESAIYAATGRCAPH